MTRCTNTALVRRIAIVCGAAAALSAPAALAQNDGRYGQPGDNSRYSTAAAHPSILNKLKGVWRVEVRANPGTWSDHSGLTTDHTNTNRPGYNPGTTNSDPSSNQPRNQTNQPGNRNQPGSQTPGSTNQPATTDNRATGMDHANFSGIAQTDLILGGNIMRERMHIMNGGSVPMSDQNRAANPDRTNPDRNNPGATPNRQPGQNDMDRWNTDDVVAECLSFISFDDATNTYNAVFMSSKDGEMYQCSGTYDDSSRRIVFHSSPSVLPAQPVSPTPAASNPATRTPGATGQPNSAQPTNRPDMNPGGRMATHPKNVRVELELLGDDQFRVTMYDDGTIGAVNTDGARPDAARPGSSAPITPTSRERGDMPISNTPNQPVPNPPNNPDRNNPDRTNPDRASGQNGREYYPIYSSNVVFQATYTRANASEANRIRNALNDAYAAVTTDR